MEHIVQEGINTKKKTQQSGGIFEDLMKTLSKQEKQRLLNRALLDPLASSFFPFLATGGANRLFKVELNILVLLSLTNFYKTRDMF